MKEKEQRLLFYCLARKIIRITPVLLLAFLFSINANAQKPSIDQLKEKLSRLKENDTTRVNLLNELARHSEISPSFRDSLVNESIQLSRKITFLKGESFALNIQAQFGDISRSINLSKQSIALAEKSGDKKSLFWAYRSLGQSMLNTSENVKAIDPFQQALDIALEVKDPALIVAGQTAMVDYYRGVVTNYPLALEWGLKALKTAEQYHDTMDLPNAYRNIGAVYLLLGDKDESLRVLKKALRASRQIGDFETAQYTLNDMGEQYRIKGMYPEALKAYGEAALLIKDSFNIELNQSNVADVYQRMGNDALCFEYAFKSLFAARRLKDTIGISWIDNILSRAYLHTGKADSAIVYASEGYKYALQTQVPEFIRDNSEALSQAYITKHDFEQSLVYYKIFIASRDSILNNEITNKAHLAQYNYNIEKKQAEITTLNKDRELQESKVQRQRLLLTGTISIILLILVSLVLLSRNISKRKRAYAELNEQKLEIQLQRDQTNHALNELKLAQTQLIQSEKMASLGELTAGIAHEIQNPLNFVNNFSEVSNELIKEMVEEVDKGNTNEVKAIANDLVQNLEKIIHHGKRADGIVKGMLQHSRGSSGGKELTDINDLADEYLRLCYHGLRAKDKSFNANFKTDFDGSIEAINIIPQDMGRVILNLLTNAFYAVAEKKKQHPETRLPDGQDYEPTVTVSTKKINNRIEIRIKDNGNGIPQKILDKIFQPFFTTKPTGQGTGLGLSLSYDIITKGHGGELKVETKEGEFAEFVITL